MHTIRAYDAVIAVARVSNVLTRENEIEGQALDDAKVVSTQFDAPLRSVVCR